MKLTLFLWHPQINYRRRFFRRKKIWQKTSKSETNFLKYDSCQIIFFHMSNCKEWMQFFFREMFPDSWNKSAYRMQAVECTLSHHININLWIHFKGMMIIIKQKFSLTTPIKHQLAYQKGDKDFWSAFNDH